MRSVVRSEKPSNSGRLRTPAPMRVSCACAKSGSRTPRKNQLRSIAPAIEAPRPAARGGEVEEYEAVEQRALAAVQDRPEAFRRMRHEVGDCHLAREDEGDRPGEKPDQHQAAAEALKHAGEAEQREELDRPGERRREAEQLHHAMGHIEEADDDAKDAEQAG